MNKTYREYIYGNYTPHLEAVSIYKKYDREIKVWRKYFARNYYPHLPKEKEARILDIGCGRGQFLLSCQAYGYTRAEGVDLSDTNIVFCQSRGLAVQQKDGLEYLSENLNTFDAIILNDVLEHLTKDEVFVYLSAMKEALKKGGIIMVKVPNMSNPILGGATLYIDFTHEVGFTEISLKQIFRALSFSEVKVFGSDIYVTPVGLWAVLKLVSKFVSLVTYLLCCLYGRKSIKIFEKHLICAAKK